MCAGKIGDHNFRITIYNCNFTASASARQWFSSILSHREKKLRYPMRGCPVPVSCPARKGTVARPQLTSWQDWFNQVWPGFDTTEGGPCGTYSGDARLQLGTTASVFNCDIQRACNERQLSAEFASSVRRHSGLIVLSPRLGPAPKAISLQIAQTVSPRRGGVALRMKSSRRSGDRAFPPSGACCLRFAPTGSSIHHDNCFRVQIFGLMVLGGVSRFWRLLSLFSQAG